MGTLARMETMGDDIRINEARIETATSKIVSLGHKQEALHRSEGAKATLQLVGSSVGFTNNSLPHPCSSSSCFVDIAALLREKEQEEQQAEELVEACMEELDTLYRERLQGRDVRQLQVNLHPILPCHLVTGCPLGCTI